MRFDFNARPLARTPAVEVTPTATQTTVEVETPLPPAVRRVLILDEPGETQALASFFDRFTHRYTYDVETASTVAETAAALRRGRPDLIVLNPRMGGIDGLQLLKQIRALHWRVPVIVVTSRDDKRTAAEALAIGVFAYVPKPCEYVSFEHIVGLTLDPRAA